jgi:hypothetical protein
MKAFKVRCQLSEGNSVILGTETLDGARLEENEVVLLKNNDARRVGTVVFANDDVVAMVRLGERKVVRFEALTPERAEALAWLREELQYVDTKYAALRPEHDEQTKLDDTLDGYGFWTLEIGRYLHRANLMGLDTLNGRQAVAKALSTCLGLVESVIRVHGHLPDPGHSSGNLYVDGEAAK